MSELKELKRDLNACQSKLTEIDKAISVAETAGEDTAALDTEFAGYDKQKKSIQRAIARKETLEDDVKDETKAEDDDEDMDEDDEDKKGKKSRKSIFASPKAPMINRIQRSKLSPAQRLGAYVWGMGSSKVYGQRHAYDQIVRTWGDETVAKAAVGAMDTTEPTIVQDAVTEVIEMLSAKSIVRLAGARVVDMPRGNKTIFRQFAGAQAFFFSEGAQTPVSKPGLDVIQMSWHQLGALVYLTKQELQFPSINTGQLVVDEIVRRIALKEDYTFLVGPGTSNTPLGILPQVANTLASTTISAAVTWQSIANDLASLEMVLSGNNEQPPFVLFTHPNVVTALKAVTNGFTFPFREELSQAVPTLNGNKIYTSTQLAASTASNVVPIIIANPQELIIADAYSYDVAMSTEGSLNDGGTQVNLWGQNLCGFLATSAVDFALAHNVSAAVLDTTAWVPSAIAGTDRYTQAANVQASSASSASGLPIS
jgi:HK97 family phage major capsid protein